MSCKHLLEQNQQTNRILVFLTKLILCQEEPFILLECTLECTTRCPFFSFVSWKGGGFILWERSSRITTLEFSSRCSITSCCVDSCLIYSSLSWQEPVSWDLSWEHLVNLKVRKKTWARQQTREYWRRMLLTDNNLLETTCPFQSRIEVEVFKEARHFRATCLTLKTPLFFSAISLAKETFEYSNDRPVYLENNWEHFSQLFFSLKEYTRVVILCGHSHSFMSIVCRKKVDVSVQKDWPQKRSQTQKSDDSPGDLLPVFEV